MTLRLNFSDDVGLEQDMLRDTAADFVASRLPLEVTRRLAKSESGVDEAVWQQMAGMGWTGILVPEKYGGMGMGLGDMAIVIKELARSAYQGPFFSSAVSSVLAIAESDDELFKKTIFPRIVDGSLIFSFALDEGSDYRWSGFSTLATTSGDGYRVNGTKLFVPYAHIADRLIVAANCGDDTGLFVVEADHRGVTKQVLQTISGAKLCEVVFDDVPAQSLLSDTSNGAGIVEKVFHSSALVNCAEMVGGAISTLAMTVDYVVQRKQFGVPIGSFQAVQHKCADMLIWVDTASMLVSDSIKDVDECNAKLAEFAAICKTWTGDAYKNTVKVAHQLMAGTGYMEETDLQLFFRHAKVSELCFGSPDFYRDVLADTLGI